MNYIVNNKGLSRLEILCIIGICVIILILSFWGYNYYKDSMSKGNDSLKASTAESVAKVNVLPEGCVVNGCNNNNNTCNHETKEGYKVGYYNPVTHDILPDKMAGYNEYHVMQIDDNTYNGKENTMIIKVVYKQDNIYLSWVEGDN